MLFELPVPVAVLTRELASFNHASICQYSNTMHILSDAKNRNHCGNNS